ncbi:MAG TPA: hypothetical protein VIF02_16600 [Methylocella sp.]
MVPKIILVSALAAGLLVAQSGQQSEALTVTPTSVRGHASAVTLAHWRGGWGGWRGGGCWNCGWHRRWWGGGPWVGRPYFYGYGYPYYYSAYYRPYYSGLYAPYPPYPRPHYSYNNAPYYPPRGLK